MENVTMCRTYFQLIFLLKKELLFRRRYGLGVLVGTFQVPEHFEDEVAAWWRFPGVNFWLENEIQGKMT